MKKLILFVVTVLCVAMLGGCKQNLVNPEDTVTEYNSEVCENVVIDVLDDDGGCYVLMSNVEIVRSEGMIVGFTINDPTVLAFQVPDRYPEGVGTIDGRDVEYIIEKLMTVLSEENLSDDTVAALEEVLGKMKDIAVLTGAST